MRVRASLISAAILAIFTGPMSAPAQLLLNGSFEDPETQAENPFGDLAAHWGRWGNWINRETAWTPTHSGKCLIGYHHWQIQEDTTSGLYQDITGAPVGSNAVFGVYAFKDEKTNIESVELRIEKYGGGQVIASEVCPGDHVKTGGWGHLSVSGTNTEPGLRVLIVVKPKQGGNREGAVKIDDATLSFN